MCEISESTGQDELRIKNSRFDWNCKMSTILCLNWLTFFYAYDTLRQKNLGVLSPCC